MKDTFYIICENLLRRKNKVMMPTYCENKIFEKPLIDTISSWREYKVRTLFSFLININSLGYTLSDELISCFLSFEKQSNMVEHLSLIMNILKEISGANKTYTPMYQNFPEEVMTKTEYELYFNQLIHYISHGTVYPASNELYEEYEKLPLKDKTELITLTLGTMEDYKNIFVNMMKSNTSISQKDRSDLIDFLENYQDAMFLIPDKIPFKENMSFIASYIFNNVPNSQVALKKLLKTATDVLRFIIAESGGDVTLSTNTKYCKFNRHKRKILLACLENCNNLEEDMNRYKNKWIRIGEILHPSEYKSVFPKVASVFYLLRNNYKIETFNSKVDSLIKQEKFLQAVELLKTRPGEFARKLDFIIRSVDEKDIINVLNAFKSIANKVSTPLLLNLIAHFLRRKNDIDKRVVFTKGNMANVYLVDKKLDAMNYDLWENIVQICTTAVVTNYSSRELMGRVYIDPELKNHIVPFSQRSASDMKNIITRGSRISVNDNTKYIRAFTWWTNQENNVRVDIDLSAMLLDESFNYIDHCSWTNISNKEYNMYLSGDIINGGPVDGDGVAEFVDIDIQNLKEHNVAYVVFSVHNYTGQRFSELTNCDFGFMEREKIDSGEIFEPKTLKNRMRINSDSFNITPVIYSVAENQFIWTDTNVHIHLYGNNMVENTINQAASVLYGIINMERTNMYDLVLYNVVARGSIVDTKEDADIIFLSKYLDEDEQYLIDDVEHPRKVITCYDIDEWYNLI